MITTPRTIIEPGSLWQNNTVLVQLLGLSPVLAMTTSLVNALALGLATFVATVACCITVSLSRFFLTSNWRLLYFVAVLGFYVSILVFLIETYFYPLSRSLGIYLPLISCNAAILFRLESFSRHVSLWQATRDGVLSGAGFLWIIVALGIIREWSSTGELLRNVDLLSPFTESFSGSGISTYPANVKFNFPVLVPGGFIILGLLLAGKNYLSVMINNHTTKNSSFDADNTSRSPIDNQWAVKHE
jgi:electron transport complex protein RnfE